MATEQLKMAMHVLKRAYFLMILHTSVYNCQEPGSLILTPRVDRDIWVRIYDMVLFLISVSRGIVPLSVRV